MAIDSGVSLGYWCIFHACEEMANRRTCCCTKWHLNCRPVQKCPEPLPTCQRCTSRGTLCAHANEPNTGNRTLSKISIPDWGSTKPGWHIEVVGHSFVLVVHNKQMFLLLSSDFMILQLLMLSSCQYSDNLIFFFIVSTELGCLNSGNYRHRHDIGLSFLLWYMMLVQFCIVY